MQTGKLKINYRSIDEKSDGVTRMTAVLILYRTYYECKSRRSQIRKLRLTFANKSFIF